MANTNYDPNARFDTGPNAAGCSRVPPSLDPNDSSKGLSVPRDPGLMTDYTLAGANSRVGFSAAGHRRDNVGPNVAGALRGYNNT